MSLLMLGMTVALLATAVFLLVSTFTSMPVSTTHAIIGAVVGMALIGTSANCLDWSTLADIATSWISSPLLSGIIGSLLHMFLYRLIISAPGVSGATFSSTESCLL
jgi:phosphate/sulfate permease